jgi:hypothetical protein
MSSRTKLVLASLRVKLIKAVSVLLNWVRLLVMAMVGMVVNEMNVGSKQEQRVGDGPSAGAGLARPA